MVLVVLEFIDLSLEFVEVTTKFKLGGKHEGGVDLEGGVLVEKGEVLLSHPLVTGLWAHDDFACLYVLNDVSDRIVLENEITYLRRHLLRPAATLRDPVDGVDEGLGQ